MKLGLFQGRKETPRLGTLRQLALFSTLSRLELRVVDGLLHERSYLKGEIIFDEGEEGQTVHAIIAGRVLICRQGEPEIIRLWYPCCADLAVAALLAAGPATRMSRLSYLLMLVGWASWAAAESTFHLSSLSLPEPPWYVKVCLMTGYVLISASVCARSARVKSAT